MPIFEYRCSDCQRTFEKIVLGRGEAVQCPDCRGARAEKLISSFAVSSDQARAAARAEPGPCACGAPRKGMCSG